MPTWPTWQRIIGPVHLGQSGSTAITPGISVSSKGPVSNDVSSCSFSPSIRLSLFDFTLQSSPLQSSPLHRPSSIIPVVPTQTKNAYRPRRDERRASVVPPRLALPTYENTHSSAL